MTEESKKPAPKRKEEDDSDDIAKQYKRFTSAAKFNLNSEEVYCICRRPDHGGESMISCDGCEEWFHFRCMKLDPELSRLIARFFCKFCEWKGVGETRWKRRCRLKGCLEPVRPEKNSKYCSDEHGVQFMRQLLMSSSKSATQSDIKALLDAVENVDQFHTLGTQFPELPEVKVYHERGDNLSQFPENVQDELKQLQGKLNRVTEGIESCNVRLAFLAKLKEKHKIINSKVMEASGSGGKRKKYELCLFDKNVKSGIETSGEQIHKLIDSSDIYADFEEEIDAIVQKYKLREQDELEDVWYNNHLCVEDKRRCPRHNGWFNLVQDGVLREADMFAIQKSNLENEVLTVLRNYSMTIYEDTK